MSEYVKDSKGKFAGSVGDGKKKVPTAARSRGAKAKAETLPVEMPTVDDAYKRFLSQSGESKDVLRAAARQTLMDRYAIDPADLGDEVTPEQVDEALQEIEEARSIYRYSQYYPGHNQYDPIAEGMLADIFEGLGYDSDEAYLKGTQTLEDVTWEGPGDEGDFSFDDDEDEEGSSGYYELDGESGFHIISGDDEEY